MPRSSPCAYTPQVSHKSPTSPVKEPYIDLKRDLLALLRSAGAICAVAERALYASIYIFDLSTMATLREIPNAHEGGVSAMAFSKDGK